MASISERTKKSTSAAAMAQAKHERPRTEVARYFLWNQIPDRILAGLLLIPAAPVLLLLVIAVRLNSRGPGIYRQDRVGRGGKVFTMYKLRTMRLDAEAHSGPTWAIVNDPRLTTLGRFLRSIHMDELPQLINVVKGEMALIGPRPERPEFTQILAQKIDGYMDRLFVRPGVTGLAQINLPPDTDLDSVRRKLVLDLEYIRTAGVLLDLRILCWTAFRLCGFRGSLTHLLGLGRTVHLPTTVETHDLLIRETTAVHSAAASTISDIPQNGKAHHHGGHAPKKSLNGVKPR